MSSAAATDLVDISRQFYSRQWQNEALFWLHVAIVISGLFMGLVLPFWVVVTVIALHRLHLKIFNGCIVSKWQASNNGLGDNENFLTQMFQRLFDKTLSPRSVQIVDYGMALVTLTVGWIAQSSVGSEIIVYLGICLFTLWGVQACWRLAGKTKQPDAAVCMVGGSCSEVRQSSFSKIAGLPVELLGLAYFIVVFMSELAMHHFDLVDQMSPLVALAAVAGVFASVAFVILQKIVLKQLCVLCMNVHGASFCLTGMIVYRLITVAA